jgi:hypothetical protein
LIGRQSALSSTVRAASARVVGAPVSTPPFDPNEKVRERFKRG